MELETHRTWEFNATAPLRSPTVPYSLYGVPLFFLKYVNMYFYNLYGWNFIGPFLLQLLPRYSSKYWFNLKSIYFIHHLLFRLVMLILSLTVDFTVYQICKLYKHSFNQCLTTLASSYIMLIYSTRFTFIILLLIENFNKYQSTRSSRGKLFKIAKIYYIFISQIFISVLWWIESKVVD